MTHPLTPREKVAAVVLDAAASYLIQQYGASHGLDHEVDRERIISAIPNDAILTALASGSGDHAGLRRLADEAADFGVPAQVDPAVLNALLAESEALREQHESDMAEMARAGQNLQSQRLALTEAERKLAEAVDEIRLIADTPYTGADWPRYRASTFLSKEAERG